MKIPKRLILNKLKEKNETTLYFISKIIQFRVIFNVVFKETVFETSYYVILSFDQ